GTYLTARRVGTAVRVVLQGAFPFPAGVLWWPQRSAGTAEEWAALIDALEVQNEAIIRAAPLEQWLPPAQTTDAAGQVHQVPHRCDQVSGVNASERFGMSTVVTLDAQDPTRVDRWSLLGATDLVYASPSSLYLLSRHWWWWPKSGEDATYVHRFDISGPATAIHQGSAALDGMVPGPFAVDELDGRLRAATTDSAGSRVMVLEPSGAELVEIGRTPDFAPGEFLEGARFVGTRGFVVTFRRVDPLFTIDLSDPAHPAVAGELTVPGFSTYLHPVSDALLVGLGRGEWGGVQVNLFDVSDLSHPRQAAALPVGPGTSEAQYDYRAFTWLPSRGLFSIPYEAGTWVNGEYLEQTALKVYQVGAAGLAEQGTLSLGDLAGALPYWCPRARVRRSILSDHDAYAVSDDAVRVARLSNLDQPVATATLALPPPPDACQVIINGRAADPQ
ncbi:MAG TPA: beta-propeller domain-containing protein, partial [Myxococcales bacterium]|nr:beta-propeller domain-containing protein [Myxococcales bacterium]